MVGEDSHVAFRLGQPQRALDGSQRRLALALGSENECLQHQRPDYKAAVTSRLGVVEQLLDRAARQLQLALRDQYLGDRETIVVIGGQARPSWLCLWLVCLCPRA